MSFDGESMQDSQVNENTSEIQQTSSPIAAEPRTAPISQFAPPKVAEVVPPKFEINRRANFLGEEPSVNSYFDSLINSLEKSGLSSDKAQNIYDASVENITSDRMARHQNDLNCVTDHKARLTEAFGTDYEKTLEANRNFYRLEKKDMDGMSVDALKGFNQTRLDAQEPKPATGTSSFYVDPDIERFKNSDSKKKMEKVFEVEREGGDYNAYLDQWEKQEESRNGMFNRKFYRAN